MPANCPFLEPFSLLRLHQIITPEPRLTLWLFRNMVRFYGEELLAPRPTLNLAYYPLSALRDCLFNIFAATLHIGGRSSIRNLRTRHAVVTGTRLSWNLRVLVLISAITVRVVTINRNSSLHVVKFNCTMFRPMYKEPSVRLTKYQKESYVIHLDYFTLSLYGYTSLNDGNTF